MFDVDFHDYGLSVFYFPILYVINLLYPSFDLFQATQVINLIISVLMIPLLASLLKGLGFNERKRFLYSISFLFLTATSWWWYALGHINGSDIPISFLVTFFLYLYFKSNSHEKISELIIPLFFLGLSKISAFSYFFLIFKKGLFKRRDILKDKLWIPLIISIILHLNFLKIKFERLFNGHISYLSSDFFVLKEILFSQNGYFITMPILFFVLFSFKEIFKKRNKINNIFILFCVMFILRTIFFSFRPIEDELFGIRMIFLDIPFLLPLSLIGIKEIFKSKWKEFSLLLLSFSALWFIYCLMVRLYLNDFWGVSFDFNYESFLEGVMIIWNSLYSFNLCFDSQTFIITLISLCLIILFLIKVKSLKRLSLYTLSIFIVIHGINLYHYEDNLIRLKKEGYFSQKVITNNVKLYLYDDVTSVFNKSMQLSRFRGNFEKEKILKNKLNSYLLELESGIISDPIGLIKSFKEKNYPLSGHSKY